MTKAEFDRLRSQWYGRARASGFQDIEAPSGIIARRRASPTATEGLAELEAARAFLHQHRFRSAFERRAWELHCDGVSNRAIAKRLRSYRKKVDRTVRRLTAAMHGVAVRGPGRPRDPDSLRSEGMRLELRLTQAAAMAIDHLRVSLGMPASEVVRRAVAYWARKNPVRTKFAPKEARPWSFDGTFPPGPITIYGLVDWRDGTIRYIGQTQSPSTRLSAHVCRPAEPMQMWMQSFPRGKRPEMVTIATCPPEVAKVVENMWIRSFLAAGWDLYNTDVAPVAGPRPPIPGSQAA